MRDALLLRLRDSLRTLALPARLQLDRATDPVHAAEELARDFEHWRMAVVSNYKQRLNEDQSAALYALDRKIEELGQRPDRSAWTEEALRHGDDWKALRDLARAALTAFDWDQETG